MVVCVQYSTKTFDENRWAIHYYAPIQGHELVARRDLISSEPDHPRAGQWYFKVQLCCWNLLPSRLTGSCSC